MALPRDRLANRSAEQRMLADLAIGGILVKQGARPWRTNVSPAQRAGRYSIMEKFLVAASQISCGPDSCPRENVAKIKSYLHQAAGCGARLVLFPEMVLSGYSADTNSVLERLKATTPKQIESIRACAQELNVATVIDLYEPAPGRRAYNTSLAIAPDGGGDEVPQDPRASQ